MTYKLESEDSLSVGTGGQKFQPGLFQLGPIFSVHLSPAANDPLYSLGPIQNCKEFSQDEPDGLRSAKTWLPIFVNNGHGGRWRIFHTVRLWKPSEVARYIDCRCLKPAADSEERDP